MAKRSRNFSRSAATARRSRRVAEPNLRFSATVRLVKTCRPSGVRPRPRVTRSSIDSRPSSRPSKRMRPLAGTNPAMPEMSEVLPAPLGPDRSAELHRIGRAGFLGGLGDDLHHIGAERVEDAVDLEARRLALGEELIDRTAGPGHAMGGEDHLVEVGRLAHGLLHGG